MHDLSYVPATVKVFAATTFMTFMSTDMAAEQSIDEVNAMVSNYCPS